MKYIANYVEFFSLIIQILIVVRFHSTNYHAVGRGATNGFQDLVFLLS